MKRPSVILLSMFMLSFWEILHPTSSSPDDFMTTTTPAAIHNESTSNLSYSSVTYASSTENKTLTVLEYVRGLFEDIRNSTAPSSNGTVLNTNGTKECPEEVRKILCPNITKEECLNRTVCVVLVDNTTATESEVSLSYNVTEVCSRGLLNGTCVIQKPECIVGTVCGVDAKSSDPWGWKLPQTAGDFLATFTKGYGFLEQPGVCGTQRKSFNESQVWKKDALHPGALDNDTTVYAAVTKTTPFCCNGYNLTEDFSCVPHCNKSCVHGYCAGPNECSCDSGYMKKPNNTDPHKCIPICPGGCKDGKCKSPADCLPVCSPGCVNANCVRLNTCECKPGFRKENPLDNTCHPFCDKVCENGECSASGICMCKQGYTRKDNSSCVPFCPWGCVNGKCTEPNQCTCSEGHIKDVKDPHAATCIPTCKNECVNGVCTAPDKCSCSPGYKPNILSTLLSTNPICEPECSTSCSNSDCTAPETCSCKAGYVKESQYKCRRDGPCDSGYTFIGGTCLPVCEKSCKNGNCIAPNTCSCFEGYKKSSDWYKCKPDCHGSCKHGDCTAPRTCTCDSGYVKVSSNECKKSTTCPSGYRSEGGNCHPVCDKDCRNGVCTAPNTCTCNSGYKPSSDWYKCKPSCRSSCEHGDCTAPDSCTCDKGYVIESQFKCKRPQSCGNGYRQEGGKCVPNCDKPCFNGTCVAPNKCSCNHGFKSGSDGRCVPHCSKQCSNGHCSAPEKCTCKAGYQLGNDRSVCVPHCSPLCVNGVCSEPNRCLCNAGFIKDRGVRTGNVCKRSSG